MIIAKPEYSEPISLNWVEEGKTLIAPSHSFLRVSLMRVRMASSLITLWKRKKLASIKSGKYRRVLDDLELLGCHPGGRPGCCAQGHYPCFETSSLWLPAPASSALKPSGTEWGTQWCIGIDCSPPWHEVGVDEALGIKEGQHHLLFPCGVDLALIGQGLPFSSHCLDCFFISSVCGWTLPTDP